MRAVEVRLPACRYAVTIGRGLLEQLRRLLDESMTGRDLVVVTEPVVWRQHGRALLAGLGELEPAAVLQVPSGEQAKSLAWASRLYDGLLKAGCDRKTGIVAFGGGVIGDLAGFVAATFMRGVPLVGVPTTLLAMVDSSVGGKVAVNHPLGKNVIGAFHQPVAVVADLATLDTLPTAQLAAGAVEAVKYGLLGDRELLTHCRSTPFGKWDLARVVADSVRNKAAVVALDEREAGPRRRLNLGHTLGHALEAATRYRGYLHGEAVAVGTLYAFRLSILRERASEADFEAVLELYESLGVPLAVPSVPFRRLMELMLHDKKAHQGRLLFVLPVGLGEVEEAVGLPEPLLARAYAELSARLDRIGVRPARGGKR
ncbi:MAG: 3-dehydroquinate synthase [Candidatus Wallbacteria bacterium]|nr:3-dehydroquinate synthase [Candidatus Wallbacteria bacterium]